MNSTESLKKHQCDKCSFASSRNFNLQRHYKRRHAFDTVTSLDQLKAQTQQQCHPEQVHQAPHHDQHHQDDQNGDGGVGMSLDKQGINIPNDLLLQARGLRRPSGALASSISQLTLACCQFKY